MKIVNNRALFYNVSPLSMGSIRLKYEHFNGNYTAENEINCHTMKFRPNYRHESWKNERC